MNIKTLKNSGFTLIELVLMVSLLGIMVVFYIESAGNVSDIAIDAASRKAQSDLRYAHQLAMTTGVTHGVKFNANGSYVVYSGNPANPITDPVTKAPMIEAFANYPGVSISNTYQAQFNSRGIPTMGSDGRVRLVATSGAQRDVYVVDKTGAVVVDLINMGSGCNCELAKAQ